MPGRFFLLSTERMLLCPRRQSNQNAAGDGSDERLRAAGAHSRLSPDPRLRGCVPSGLCMFPAGKIKICFCPTIGPLGPTAIKICKTFHTNVHRLVRPYLFGAAVVGHSATAQPPQFCCTRRCYFNCISPKFLFCRPQWAGARRTQGLVFRAAGRKCLSSRRASPVKRGSGGNDCEHRRRQGAHRKRPPAHLWLLSVLAESNTVAPPPRRAEFSN